MTRQTVPSEPMAGEESTIPPDLNSQRTVPGFLASALGSGLVGFSAGSGLMGFDVLGVEVRKIYFLSVQCLARGRIVVVCGYQSFGRQPHRCREAFRVP